MTCGTRKTGGTKLLFSNFQPTENMLTFEVFVAPINYFNLVLELSANISTIKGL